MTGSVALDVVIGLVFIYLIYSLLVSIVAEMLATWFGIRARMLRLSIERMLNDGAEVEPGKAIGQFFLYEFQEFKETFAGRFYDTYIKALSKGQKKVALSFRHGKPSYISADNFADTMIHLFRNGGGGNTDMKRVDFCLRFNTLNIQPETLSYLNNLSTDSGGEVDAFKEKLRTWYNDTQDRANGWYKRKLQLILFWLGFLLAVAFNIDSIKMARQLSDDTDARNQLVQMGIQASDENSPISAALKRSQDPLITDSLLIESYNQTKLASDAARHVLGLSWNFEKLFKPNSIDISLERFQKLEDSSARILKRITDTQNLINTNLKIAQREFSISKKNSTLTKIKQLQISLSEMTVALNVILKTNFSSVNNFRRLSDIDTSYPNNIIRIFGQRRLYETEKIGYVFTKTIEPIRLIGFIITALMISLGAPFWFDLLKKLVAIRGAGVNPVEKEPNTKEGHSEKTTKPPSSIIIPSREDPVDEALRIYGEEIRKIPGVLSVIRGYVKNSKNVVEDCVEVVVKKGKPTLEVRSKFKKLTVSGPSAPTIKFTEIDSPRTYSGQPLPTSGIKDKALINKTEIFSWGSFGCLVKSKDEPEKKYILSCYHVMNGDYNWSNDGKNKIIMNAEKKEISTEYQGFLAPEFDIAYATIGSKVLQQYKDLDSFKKPTKFREVSKADVFKTRITIEGLVTSPSHGLIVHDSFPISLLYETRMLGVKRKYLRHNFVDLILISHEASNDKTKGGDSGSLVLDDKNEAIGIVLGGDSKHTYAMKISNVFDSLGLELET